MAALDLLRELVELESPTYSPGVRAVAERVGRELEAIRRAGDERRALRVFLTADEEIGSVTARPLLEEAADAVAAGLVVEPPGSSGNLKTARKGLGRFTLTIKGRPA